MDASADQMFMNCSGFSQGRWPRQEAMTLLEVRMRLHPKFKQAATTPKAPLWDEVSRIMAEEHGYQRSGKKCKEKLDNLYKYYKKTKGGNNTKGSTVGKHYRFFNQLDALYGQNHITPTTTITHLNPQLIMSSPSISIESDSEDDDDDEVDIRELINMQIKKLMEVQESGLEKMVKAIERIEQERIAREEARRKEEIARSKREEEVWARERAWIVVRDAALIDALNKISCKNDCAKQTTTEVKEKERVVPIGVVQVEEEYDPGNELVKLQSWVEESEFHEGLCREQWFP